MTTERRSGGIALALIVALCATFLPSGLGTLPVQAAGAVNLTTFGSTYTQDFNTLASSGTANTAVPTGWEFSESGTNANTTYRAGTGSDNAGDTYSFGTTSDSERAFGGLRSGSLVPLIGAQFANNTGGTISSIVVSYTGEQWRLGQNTTGRSADKLDFQLSTNATSITTGTWTDYDSLDFSSPVVAGTLGALNGNIAPNRTALSFTITGLSVPNGASFWLRWADTDLIPGADDGLSVDDFALTAQGVSDPIPDTAAPGVVSSVPLDDAIDVAANAVLTIKFSEAVTLEPSLVVLDCGPSGAKTFAVSGGPTDFSIDPTADFAPGDVCTLTIPTASVSDQDTNDPPDTMAEVFSISFTVVDPCTAAVTPIPAIQGSGLAAAITGAVTTEGVVVGDYEGQSPALRGFFIQDPNGDGSPATSDGIFVFEGSNANSVSVGDLVRVTGTAGENQGQTQVSVGTIVKCGTSTVNPTAVTLPVASPDFLEQYEGMLVGFPQTLYVTEHFQLGRFGQVVLSAGGRLKQPTNVVVPGVPALALQAQNDLNSIILDDASQVQNPDPIIFARGGQPLSASNTLRGGDTATGIVGVLNYTWAGNAASPNAYRVRTVNALGGSVNFVAANQRPATAPAVGGRIRVAGMNLLNFFNTFDGDSSNPPFACNNGVGGALTDCRGAGTAGEFARQWPKTVAAIVGTGADIIGVIEVENDGYGPDSALQFLVNQLNAATAPGAYALIDVDAATGQLNALGTDAIKVGLIYKPAMVAPVGQTAALNSADFVNGGDNAPRSRPALAQAFQENSSGSRFIVSVNHFKSKGSACDAPDAGDGQGNCNAVRVNAAAALVSWFATDPTGTGDPDVLIVGDLNSYAKEEPISTLISGGYTNLIESFLGPDAYSYVFDGQWGYLDHALGSATLLSQVSGVGEWHINADEPSVLDYNTDFKTANLQTTLYAADQFRISDHDPVLVGLNPANVPPTVGPITGPTAPVAVNTTVQFQASFTDPGIVDTHTAVWNWGDGTPTSPGIVSENKGSGTVSGSHSYATPGVYTVVLTVNDNNGGSGQSPVFQYVVVYDPNGGFVTGGGWIDSPAGAYLADPALAGKASFGFVSKYQKGTSVPTGTTQFQFQAAGFNFQSTSYEWLVIAGAKAQYKGSGTINGAGDYGFMLTAVDGERNGTSDRFRIKIWDKSAPDNAIYDNMRNVSDGAEPSTVLGGGSIVVHDAKVGKSDAGEEPEVTNRLFLPGVMR